MNDSLDDLAAFLMHRTADAGITEEERYRTFALVSAYQDGDDPPALQVPDAADDPEASLARQEGFARLDRALATLPADLRECLVLRELEELSYKEVAQVTGVPVGTVMSRLWRARQALMQSGTEGRAP